MTTSHLCPILIIKNLIVWKIKCLMTKKKTRKFSFQKKKKRMFLIVDQRLHLSRHLGLRFLLGWSLIASVFGM